MAKSIASLILYGSVRFIYFMFFTYSVGRQPIYFLKHVAKYDGVLNPIMSLISAML